MHSLNLYNKIKEVEDDFSDGLFVVDEGFPVEL